MTAKTYTIPLAASRQRRNFAVRLALAIMAFCVAVPAFSQGDNRRLVRKGNTQYLDSMFNDAETTYRKALKKNAKDPVANFNLGNSLLRQRNPKDAAQQYEAAIKNTKNPLYQAKAYHNLGVILQSQKQYDEAITSYANALRNNPRDDESRYNLALCRHLKQQQQQNKDNQQDKNKDEKDDKKQQQKPQQDKQQQEKQQQQNKNQMSKDNADRLLDAAKQEEQKTQEKLRKGQQYASPRSLDKNW
jgi:tetratricopeptide (TPR) repeat protein